MCTVFKYQSGNSFLLGKNYDVPSPCYGAVIFNPKGLEKQALIKLPEKSVEWKAVYSSITFNQVAREFPASGMNEKGLVVEQTTLWNTIFPDKDERKAITELQVIQFLLDTSSTMEQAIQQLQKIRIAQNTTALQYVIADSEGNICLVEFILGEMKVYENENFEYATITNDMLQTSVDYLHTHQGFGGTKQVTSSQFSLDRYVATVKEIASLDKQVQPDIGFEVLNKTRFEDTQWQIVYDPRNFSIEWKTRANTPIKRVCMNDFLKSDECQLADVNTPVFAFYHYIQNYELARKFFQESHYFKTLRISEKDIELVAHHANYTNDIKNEVF